MRDVLSWNYWREKKNPWPEYRAINWEWRDDALAVSLFRWSWKIFRKYVSIHSSRITIGGKVDARGKNIRENCSATFFNDRYRANATRWPLILLLSPPELYFSSLSLFFSPNVPMFSLAIVMTLRRDASPFPSFFFSFFFAFSGRD